MAFDRRLFFPLLLLAGNLGASVMCFASGDWKRGIYWLCSGICIAAVTL